jgi:hypothetical protein
MPIKPEEEVKQYIHEEQKRANNPPVGLVSAENENHFPNLNDYDTDLSSKAF